MQTILLKEKTEEEKRLSQQAETARLVMVEKRRREALEKGMSALQRLIDIAESDYYDYGHQVEHVRLFLLGLYNSALYPFELNRICSQHADLIDDCLAVLNLFWRCRSKDIDDYIPGSREKWQRWHKEMQAETA